MAILVKTENAFSLRLKSKFESLREDAFCYVDKLE